MTPAESRARTLELAKELESHRPMLRHPELKGQDGQPLVLMGMNNDGSWAIAPTVAQACPQEIWQMMAEFVQRCLTNSNGHSPPARGRKRGA